MTTKIAVSTKDGARSEIGRAEMLVDWGRGEVRTREVKGKTRRERYYPVLCPTCGDWRWLLKQAAQRAQAEQRQCGRCARAEIAPMGYAATARKYGVKFAVKHVQAHRRENPSTLEQAIALLLGDLGIDYEREVMICTKASGRKRRCHLADFVINGRVIDVRGEYVHSSDDAKRRDTLFERLMKRRGVPMLVIWERDIKSGRAESMLTEFLQ